PPLRSGEGGRREFPLSRRERGSGDEDLLRGGQGGRTSPDVNHPTPAGILQLCRRWRLESTGSVSVTRIRERWFALRSYPEWPTLSGRRSRAIRLRSSRSTASTWGGCTRCACGS